VEHALGREALQGADGHAIEAQLRVVVVLDDQAVVALRPLQEGGAPLGGQHGAGREVVRRRDHDRCRVGRVERRDIEAGFVDGDRHYVDARLLGDQAVLVPARILHRDLLDAVAAQPAARERQALREAGADEQ
jgi:hypothetical protein